MDFSDNMEAQHERLDRSELGRVYAVGNVHAYRKELDRLPSGVNPNSDDPIVSTSDLVKKGPDSRRIVDVVRSSPVMLSICMKNKKELLNVEKSPPDLTGDDLD